LSKNDVFKCLLKQHVSVFHVVVTPAHAMQGLGEKYKNTTCLACWKCDSVLCFPLLNRKVLNIM